MWHGDFFLPLLGIAFLPFTTIMYMLVWTPNGVQGWDWLWILVGRRKFGRTTYLANVIRSSRTWG